ncbi:tyrosine-type recombinase/integrase [Streptomyces anthocyanicus]|uniref:tyrosine-type recombinase/integrase n=1 Tax=Streptomyces anthocyanicus TaxID=68174 RepID=UPI002E351184|nr:tyrosine-type recombinase/integrase [Streptomyces anthocyanicus]
MQAFPVLLPSGARYWTVVDDDVRPVPTADHWLRYLRFGKDRAESTTKSYAGGAALYLSWCELTGRDWRVAARDLGLFILWLKWTSSATSRSRTKVVFGPGSEIVRHERRTNTVLTAVRGLLAYAVSVGKAPTWVLGQIYNLADSSSLPQEAQGESGGLFYRMGARHRLPEPESDVDRASDEEIVSMFLACRNARDRLIVLLLSRVGLRRGQAAGLHRSDCHLLPDSRGLGCKHTGAHLHIVRRQNENGAWSKSRKEQILPVDFLVVQAFDQYCDERHARLGTGGSDFLLVNLFQKPLGEPMPPGAINEIYQALNRRARLSRNVAPHISRHAAGSNWADADATLDEVQALLGQKNPESARPYLHPAAIRLREAVERVPSPRVR